MRKLLWAACSLAAAAFLACASPVRAEDGDEAAPAPEKGAKTEPDWLAGAVRMDKRKERDKYNAFLARYAPKEPAAGLFPQTCAACALPEDQLPRMIEGHPRLLLRVKPWKYGLSLDQLRARARQAPWAAQFKKTPSPKDGAACALYYLATGDEKVVPGLIDRVLAIEHVGYGMGGEPFLIYDWIYNSPSLTPRKKELEDKLVKLGFDSASLLEGGNCGDVWRHRGGGGIDILLAGLALAGERPEGAKLLAQGLGYWRRAYLPSYQLTGGGWLGGQSSYTGMVRPAPLGLACWASATDQDIYRIIKQQYGDWLENRMYFWMHALYPDKSVIDSIGVNHCAWRTHQDRWPMLAKALGNADAYHFMRWKGEDPTRDILFYDEELDKKPASAVFTGPHTRVWGRDGLGYVQMRSKGWQPDSVVVEIKFSKFLWNHALQSNQGSFYIFHKGRLALQGGTYDSFGRSDHWDYYYRRTISSNSMLIFAPGEFALGGGPTAERDGGFVREPGGQFAESMARSNFTADEYLWHVRNDPRYDWARITAFEHAADFRWSYVSGDATNAYNNPGCCRYVSSEAGILANRPKIDRFTRSLVYVPPACLIVFDRVNALDPSYRKAWLLQTIGKPQVSGRIVRAEVPGHVEDFDGDTLMTTWPNGVSKPADPKDPGRLIVKSFLPAEHTIRRIGGEGCEFWVDGANRPPAGGQARQLKYLPGDVLADVYDEARQEGQNLANWRIEISPARESNFDQFLNLLWICDTGTDKLPPAGMVTAEGGRMVGLAVGGWVVLFGATGEVDGELSYQAPDGRNEHLLADLRRGAKYKVSGIAGGDRELAASAEGTLRFATEKTGVVRLSPAG
jgi:hypothetical protein